MVTYHYAMGTNMETFRKWWQSKAVQRVIIGAAALLVPVHVALAEELRMLTWQGYAEPAFIEEFEKAEGVTVSRTYVGSNDEYMAKLAAGGGDYDLTVIVSSLAQTAIKAGFVEPIDVDKLSNWKDLPEAYRKLDFNESEGKVYGVCTFWGTQPVTVNAKEIPEGGDYGVLFDPKYSGKIAMWDDVSTLGEVASFMGYDNIWTLSDEQLDAVKKKMIEQKKLLRKYWTTPGEIIALFGTGEVVASNSWNFITQEAKRQGINVRDFNPNPPIGWIDSHFIVKGSKHQELATKLIDHLISAKVQAMIGEKTGYSVCNPKAKEFMDAATWDRLYMDEGISMLKEMKFWEEIPRRAKYLEILNEVKAASVQ